MINLNSMNMKAKSKILGLFIALGLTFAVLPKQAEAQDVSFQIFYDQLSPYGQWVEHPNYGFCLILSNY